MKRFVKILIGWVAVLTLVVAVTLTVASSHLNAHRMKVWNVEGPRLDVRYADPQVLARGEHLARAVAACTDCHGADFGGRTFVDDPGLGTLVGPNLTTGRGGRGARLGEADWSRAMTRGVGDSHRSLMLMPARDFETLSTEDLSAIVAYARTRPPVDRDPGESVVRPLGKFLYLIGNLPALMSAEDVSTAQAPRVAVAPGRTVEYGRYLAGTCVGCHREDYRGGPMVGAPPDCPNPSNLTPTGLAAYTQADLVRALREGKARDGHTLNKFMPYRVFMHMTDDELAAIYMFLKTLPPKPTGT